MDGDKRALTYVESDQGCAEGVRRNRSTRLIPGEVRVAGARCDDEGIAQMAQSCERQKRAALAAT